MSFGGENIEQACALCVCLIQCMTDIRFFKILFLVALSEIKRIITGVEYSEMVVQQFGTKLLKKSSSSAMLRNGFSFELKEKGELLTLSTENEEILKGWIDGLNILLGNQILNQKEFEEEV